MEENRSRNGEADEHGDDTQYLRTNEPERGFSVILCRQAPISAPAMQTMGTVILAMSLLSLCLCLSISGILTRSIANQSASWIKLWKGESRRSEYPGPQHAKR